METNKTPEEIREDLLDSINSAYSKYGRWAAKKRVLEWIKEYGEIEFRRALDLAAEKAKIKWNHDTTPIKLEGREYNGIYEPLVDKDSILNLKILDV